MVITYTYNMTLTQNKSKIYFLSTFLPSQNSMQARYFFLSKNTCLPLATPYQENQREHVFNLVT